MSCLDKKLLGCRFVGKTFESAFGLKTHWDFMAWAWRSNSANAEYKAALSLPDCQYRYWRAVWALSAEERGSAFEGLHVISL